MKPAPKTLFHLFALLILMTGCNKEEKIPSQTTEQKRPGNIQLQPLPTPQLFLIEEAVTQTSVGIGWQTDSRAANYLYLLDFSEDSLIADQGVIIVEPPLILGDLTPNTSYNISLRAVPKNMLLYTASEWSEIEITTKADPSEYPDWGEEPERPKDPITPGEELPLSIENLCGAWQLYEWTASEKFPSLNTDIYIAFKEDLRFDLYQKNINFIGIVHFSGEYRLDTEQRTISGRYDDGTNWGATYFIEGLFENLLTWSTREESSSYVRIEEIPEEILNQTQSAEETRTSPSRAIL